MKPVRQLQNPVAADVSPRHFGNFAPTDVGGYAVLKDSVKRQRQGS
jgi:hypothetical protein